MKGVLASHHLKLTDVMDLPVVPIEIQADIIRAQMNKGERVQEREDYLDIRACRPIPDSFSAFPDDEL